MKKICFLNKLTGYKNTPYGDKPQLNKEHFNILDFFCLLLMAALLLFFIYRIKEVPYKWEWEAIPQFLLWYDQDNSSWHLGRLSIGLISTLKLSFWANIFAVIFGLALATMRLSKIKYVALMARSVLEICRNLPPLVFLFIIYYFISDHLIPWNTLINILYKLPEPLIKIIEFFFMPLHKLNSFFPALSTLALYEGAYMAEIFRGGILSIKKGQWEASYCLGLKTRQQYRFVILPQVFTKVMPQLANQFISTIKDSTIIAIISIEELMESGLQIMKTTGLTFEIWLSIALIYIIINFSLSVLFRKLEKGGLNGN